jgi:signal transduction histidine kinase
MHLSPRHRFVIAMLVSWPIGFLYLDWAFYNGVNIIRWYRSGIVNCNPVLLTVTNGCTPDTYSVTFAWAQLLIVTAIVVAIGFMLARWVLRPVSQMADTVARLGPTSLGVRLAITGRNDETKRLGDAIDTMLDRVAEGYQAQQRFAANASHELRTPLATQRALIEVSLADALTPDQLDLVSRQLLATNARNEALIEGLLVLAETDRGLVSRSPQRLDLIVSAVIESFRPAAKEAGVDIEATLDPVEVAGEAPLLERLVSNLVQNAIKYNQSGGWVRIALRGPGLLTVTNSGARVQPESVAGLFEPFRRGSGERLEHGGGVGLGLTIARSVVAAHGGTIDATANASGGLAVVVSLPVVAPRGALRSDNDARGRVR